MVRDMHRRSCVHYCTRLAATTAAKEMSESLSEGTRQSYTELQREYSEALSHFEKDLKERDEVGYCKMMPIVLLHSVYSVLEAIRES